MSPQHGLRTPKEVSNPPPTKASTAGTSALKAPTASETAPATPATPPPTRNPRSPTTSSPALLEEPPSPRPRLPSPTPRRPAREGRIARNERRATAGPYPRRQDRRRDETSPTVSPAGVMRATSTSAALVPAHEHQARPRGAHPQDLFIPARWPFSVAHLRAQFNPTGVVFRRVPHFGWCDCEDPCRVGRCRNSLMQLYCTVNCCPYGGNCGNSVVESTEVALMRNVVTGQLAVVAQGFIAADVILGEYLGEIEHVSASRTARPRNEGYRLVMTQRPEIPSHPVRVAVNAQHMGGHMRFVTHSCAPVARFLEVANGRRTAVMETTTHAIYEGDEITVDYGPDLWFVCRCGHANCRHRDIQNEQDP
ncbi:hypothetical protein PF010_g2057 [Phytophthora fragariae]|uniref:SET domain-containing protein n=1 Tax=Phytophthora fragariae TaxID=53985 RepID=A0A6G0LY82_9STRA|nr:hypothetical protein PF010_g2057 [Phytophthora fragariae]